MRTTLIWLGVWVGANVVLMGIWTACVSLARRRHLKKETVPTAKRAPPIPLSRRADETRPAA